MSQLVDAIAEAMKTHIHKGQLQTIVNAVVCEVGDATCVVQRDDYTMLYDVRLNAIDNSLQSYVTVYPKVGSNVLIGVVENMPTEAVVLRCSEVERVDVKIEETTLALSSKGVVLNGGSLGGMVKVNALVQRLNKLEQELNTLKTTFAGWIPAAADGGAALKTATAVWASNMLPATTLADLENKQIRQ